MKKLILLLILILSLSLFVFIACGDGEEDTDAGEQTDETDTEQPEETEVDEPDGEETDTEKPDVTEIEKPDEDTEEEVTITFMVGGAPNEIAFWEEIVKEFQGETGIRVEIIRQTTDTDQRKQGIVAALKGKETDPDIFLMDVVWIGELAYNGWLQPLNNLEVDTEPFFKSIIDRADTYFGRLIGLPIYVDAGLLYYRTDLLEKYGYDGPPETWGELLEIATTAQAGEKEEGNENFWGHVWQGMQYEGLTCTALEFFESNNGGYVNEEGDPVLNQEANIEALEFMTALIQEHEVSPPNTYTDMDEENVRITFENGNAMFERNWPYAWNNHQNNEDSKVSDNFGIAPLPMFEGGKSAATLGGWHAGVSKYSDNPEEAAEFLKYITSYDIQKTLVLNLGWNPGRTDLYNDEEVISKLPHLERLKNVFVNAVPRPGSPYYARFSNIIQKYVNSSLAGDMEPKPALDKAQSEVAEVVKEN
jgi:multiple sugar transport system substrate-binding protein